MADPPPRRRFIVADDDVEMRDWLAIVLRPLGATVVEAADGAALVALLCDGSTVDLVVTDVHMPSPNGLEVLEMARTAGSRTRFLLLTAFADDGLRAAARLLDASVVEKPVTARELLEVVASLLE